MIDEHQRHRRRRRLLERLPIGVALERTGERHKQQLTNQHHSHDPARQQEEGEEETSEQQQGRQRAEPEEAFQLGGDANLFEWLRGSQASGQRRRTRGRRRRRTERRRCKLLAAMIRSPGEQDEARRSSRAASSSSRGVKLSCLARLCYLALLLYWWTQIGGSAGKLSHEHISSVLI